jgi:hypothetical protein
MRRRRIKATEIINDIRSGMSASELMVKYDLRTRQVSRLYRQLEERMAAPAELYPRSWSTQCTCKIYFTRSHIRHDVSVALPVHVLNNQRINGLVMDISEKGLRIRGMETRLGRFRNMVIRADHLGLKPVAVGAECRWVTKTGFQGKSVAGFEIVEISRRDREGLRPLIDKVAAAHENGRVISCIDEDKSGKGTHSELTMPWKCPACGMPQSRNFEECPQCVVIVLKYIHQKRRVQVDTVVIDVMGSDNNTFHAE